MNIRKHKHSFSEFVFTCMNHRHTHFDLIGFGWLKNTTYYFKGTVINYIIGEARSPAQYINLLSSPPPQQEGFKRFGPKEGVKIVGSTWK